MHHKTSEVDMSLSKDDLQRLKEMAEKYPVLVVPEDIGTPVPLLFWVDGSQIFRGMYGANHAKAGQFTGFWDVKPWSMVGALGKLPIRKSGIKLIMPVDGKFKEKAAVAKASNEGAGVIF